MKKIIFLFICSLIIFSVLFGCENSEYKTYKKYVSELRTNVFTTNIDNLEFEAITGYKEKNYKNDGLTDELIPFTVITVNNIHRDDINYSVVINGVEYYGLMYAHPYENSISCEIVVIESSNKIPIALKATGLNIKGELKGVFDKNKMITYIKAFSIAKKSLSKQIKEIFKNSSCEIHIRLTKNPLNDSLEYYWYIELVTKNNKTYAVLIDPKTEKILAVRE